MVGVYLRHHSPNICKVEIISLKVRLAGPVVLWWKALQDYVFVPAVQGDLLECEGTQAVAEPVLLVEKSHRDLHLTAFSPFPFLGTPLAKARTSSRRTSRVELPMRPVHVLGRISWSRGAEQIMIGIISTLTSGRLIVVQS